MKAIILTVMVGIVMVPSLAMEVMELAIAVGMELAAAMEMMLVTAMERMLVLALKMEAAMNKTRVCSLE